MTETNNTQVIQAMIGEIGDNLRQSLVPSLNSSSGGDDIYEAYLFTLICKAAEREGATVTLRSIGTEKPVVFVFRTSPGFIASERRDYGYAILEFPDKPILEAHLGIRVAGSSNVLHECDVCVLLQDEANFCRQSNEIVAPKASKVIISVEAKFYASSLELMMGRAFLGFTIDVRSDKSYFVINKKAPSIAKLLSSKKRLWDHNVQPQNTIAVERLRNAFQTAFKDFKAKYSQSTG
jgi:hypothetical protein